jgi:hypothetical protein
MGLGLLGGQPDRAAPDALGAEGEGRSHLATVPDAASGQHRDRAYGIDDLGDQHHRGDRARVPAGLVALRDHQVDARLDVTPRVLDGARQRRHLDAVLAAHLDHPGRRRPERRGDQADGMLEDQLDHVALLLVADRELGRELDVGLQRRHAVLLEQILEELLVLRRQSLVHLLGVQPTSVTADEFAGQQQIYAEGLVADLVRDPLELHLEVLERVPRHPEHTEPAGLRDSGGHVAAVGEGKDRELESELLSELGSHGAS